MISGGCEFSFDLVSLVQKDIQANRQNRGLERDLPFWSKSTSGITFAFSAIAKSVALLPRKSLPPSS